MVSELFLTGGEPFMLLDLHERLRVAATAMPTTVLTNAMLWSGERLRLLEELPRDGLTLQISLDSASPELHDRHRGTGSFARAFAGIRLAMDLGFRVRVAATLGADAASSESDLEALFDELGLDRWHPVAAIDPAMKVSSEFSPLGEVIDGIRQEYRTHRISSDVLASTFPCG